MVGRTCMYYSHRRVLGIIPSMAVKSKRTLNVSSLPSESDKEFFEP